MARFYTRGTTVLVACPIIAGPNPVRTEITSGTKLIGIAASSGFTLANSPFPVPDLDDTFTKTVLGEDTAGDSSLTFWDDNASTVVRTALAKGTAFKLLKMPYGDIPTKRCEIWAVTSTGVNDTLDLSSAGQFVVGFSIDARPLQNAVIPA